MTGFHLKSIPGSITSSFKTEKSKDLCSRASYTMHKHMPGDLVVVPVGAYMRSASDSLQCWNDDVMLAIVVSKSTYLYIDSDYEDELSGSVSIFIPGTGFFYVEEMILMTPDELTSTRLKLKAFFERKTATHELPSKNTSGKF